MKAAKISYRKQWGKVLTIALLSLMVMLVLTFFSSSISDWIPILFCWGDVLIFSAIPVMLLALLANNPLPKIKQERQNMPWALVGGLSLYALFAIMPSYYEGTERMYDLACFGTMLGGMGFIMGWVAQRRTLILIAGLVLPFVWARIFDSTLLVNIFALVTLVGSIAFVFWWNKVDPPKQNDSDPPKIEDILSSIENENGLSQEWSDWIEDDVQPDEVRGFVWVLLVLLLVFLIAGIVMVLLLA